MMTREQRQYFSRSYRVLFAELYQLVRTSKLDRPMFESEILMILINAVARVFDLFELGFGLHQPMVARALVDLAAGMRARHVEGACLDMLDADIEERELVEQFLYFVRTGKAHVFHYVWSTTRARG